MIALAVLIAAGWLTLAGLVLHFTRPHGRNCTCQPCWERKIAEARRRAYEEGRGR